MGRKFERRRSHSRIRTTARFRAVRRLSFGTARSLSVQRRSMQTRGQANFRISAAPLRKKAEPAQEFRKNTPHGLGPGFTGNRSRPEGTRPDSDAHQNVNRAPNWNCLGELTVFWIKPKFVGMVKLEIAGIPNCARLATL